MSAVRNWWFVVRCCLFNAGGGAWCTFLEALAAWWGGSWLKYQMAAEEWTAGCQNGRQKLFARSLPGIQQQQTDRDPTDGGAGENANTIRERFNGRFKTLRSALMQWKNRIQSILKTWRTDDTGKELVAKCQTNNATDNNRGRTRKTDSPLLA